MGMYADAAAALADGCIHNWKFDSGEGDSIILDAIGSYDGAIVSSYTGSALSTLEATTLGEGRRIKMGEAGTADNAILNCDPADASLTSAQHWNASARIRIKFDAITAFGCMPLSIGDRNSDLGSCVFFVRDMNSTMLTATAKWSRPSNAITGNISADGDGYIELVATSEGTSSGCTLRLYSNGSQIGSSTTGSNKGGIDFYSTILAIGSGIGSDVSYAVDGVVDDVALWNRTLSAAEVSSLYQQAVITQIVPVENSLDINWNIGQPVESELSLLWRIVYPDPAELATISKPVIYRTILSGSANGLSDLEIPISSFNARLRSGRESYLSIVAPNGSILIDEIEARPDGELFIEELVGETSTELARVNFQNLRIDKGARSGTTLQLSGYKQTTNTTPKTWEINDHSYFSRSEGKSRVRAQSRAIINPLDQIICEGVSFIADTVTVIGSVNRIYMEIAE